MSTIHFNCVNSPDLYCTLAIATVTGAYVGCVTNI